MLDTKALAAATAAIVREHLVSELAPLVAENKALRERVEALESRSVKAGPAGADGQDGRDGADGKDGEPGADGDAGADGQDGRDGVDGKDGLDGQDGKDGKDGRDGVDGKDGAGIADLVIDRDGNLIASFTDGRMKHLGQVVGKDGRDGGDGKDGIPFGVDDLDMTLMEDGRTLRMSFTKGDTEYAFQIPFPVVIDRGVFADGKSYEEGDGVTWGGSFWIAQRSTGAKPDSPDSGWRLAVKRGRDGKDKV